MERSIPKARKESTRLQQRLLHILGECSFEVKVWNRISAPRQLGSEEVLQMAIRLRSIIWESCIETASECQKTAQEQLHVSRPLLSRTYPWRSRHWAYCS